jgi:hypothetical protein
LARSRGLAGRDVADVDAGLLQHARDLDGVGGRDALLADPVIGRDAHRDRLVVGPDRADRAEDLQRVAHAVFEAAAIFVVRRLVSGEMKADSR